MFVSEWNLSVIIVILPKSLCDVLFQTCDNCVTLAGTCTKMDSGSM